MPDSLSLHISDRVTHMDFGAGRVIALLRGGRVIRVEFDEMPDAPWDIPKEELELLSASPDEPGYPRIETTSPLKDNTEIPERETRVDEPKCTIEFPKTVAAQGVEASVEPGDSVSARQALEALRLGVVPSHHIDTYTIGRDAELGAIVYDLEHDPPGGLKVVLGDYGTGKTHFLELVERLALGRGFLSTRVTLDSKEVLPSRPRRIYHILADKIRYPDLADQEPAGLGPLLSKAAADAKLVRRWSGRGSTDKHPYLGPALVYRAAMESNNGIDQALSERLMDWIGGGEVASNQDLENRLRHATGVRARLYALMDHRTVTHIYTLILGGIAELARQLGYAGLVVTVDEAEFYSVLRGRDRSFAEVLFKTFAASCLLGDELHFDPSHLPRGGAAVHQSFNYRHSNEQPLYCVFALTHDPNGERLLKNSLSKDRFLELKPFGAKDYVTLAERVLGLYRLARVDFLQNSRLASTMALVIEACHRQGLIENPRQALKFITEIVDLTRYAPHRISAVLKELKHRLGIL